MTQDVLSLADLEAAKNITFQQITDTVKDYAETGAAIGIGVPKLLERALDSMTSDLRKQLQEAALTGAVKQRSKQCDKDALDFLDVLVWLDQNK